MKRPGALSLGGLPMSAEERRCGWARSSPEMGAYHDRERGVPVHDDRKHFELLVLEGARAGLGWATILGKRRGDRLAFAALGQALRPA
jgi:DNA-3-methyladenine glycosylase I